MLTGNDLTLFRETLLTGGYNLLLGAGVSLDSTNASGTKLRSAGKLCEDLCTLKGVRPTTPLHRVCTLLTGAEHQRELVDAYSGCVAGRSLQPLSNYVWRRIFTFNIDDVVEAHYRGHGTAKQRLSAINFNAPFEPTPHREDLQIVHMHGSVQDPAAGFVFSYTEYARVMTELNPWMHMLSEILATESFLIAGTSLNEVDLEYYLSHRSDSTPRRGRGPSLLIEPFPDAITQVDCARHGLILVKATFGEFLEWLRQEFPAPPSISDLYIPDVAGLFVNTPSPQELLRFFSDFRVVEAGDLPSTNVPTAFLYGRPPQQSDLDRHVDIPRNCASAILQDVENAFAALSTGLPQLHIVSDTAGTGKTTLIHRVGHDCVRRGKPALALQTLARLDVDAAVSCLAAMRTPVLLLVDGIADYAEQVLALLQHGKLSEKIVVLASERSYRQKLVDLVFGGISPSIKGVTALSKSERRQLVALYNGLGLIGIPEAVANPDRFAEQLRNDPIAVAACRILNDFRPLDNIVTSLWEATDVNHRLPYLCVALAYHCSRAGIRFSIVQGIAGVRISISQLMANVTAPLGIAFSNEGTGHLVPLNGVLGEQILQRAIRHERDLLYEAFTRLAAGLAPHVNRRAIMLRTPEARLARRLFDGDTITKPLLGSLAEDFYIAVQREWRWNSRYWEQRALLASETDLTTAVQYARHAVSIERHPFPLTTLGKLLLLQMDEEVTSRDALFSGSSGFPVGRTSVPVS